MMINQFILKIKANKITLMLIVLIGIIVLYTGFRHQQIAQAIVYLFTCFLSVLIIDYLALKFPNEDSFQVKKPLKETIIFFSCLSCGMVFLFIRFSGVVNWEHLNGIVKLAFMPLILGVFPVALAIILLLMRYTPAMLGLRIKSFWWSLPIILLFATAAHFVAPDKLTWDILMNEMGGVLNLIFTGLIVAGLSEEFFRVIGQTRLGALLKNNGLAWLITSIVWAFMHAPKWYGDDPNLIETILSSIRIIPIGLVWGYLTHRSKSLVPATLVHGANVWGLQNF